MAGISPGYRWCMVWMTITTVCEILEERGVHLYINPSHNVPGDTTAQERLDEAIDEYQKRLHATKYAAEAFMARIFLFYTGRYGKTELPGGVTKDMVCKWIDDCVTSSGYKLVGDQRNLWSYTNTATEDNSDYHYKYVVDNKLSWVGNSSDETLFANKHNMKSDWTYTWFTNTVSQYFSPSADDYDKFMKSS